MNNSISGIVIRVSGDVKRYSDADAYDTRPYLQSDEETWHDQLKDNDKDKDDYKDNDSDKDTEKRYSDI